MLIQKIQDTSKNENSVFYWNEQVHVKRVITCRLSKYGDLIGYNQNDLDDNYPCIIFMYTQNIHVSVST